MAKRRDVSLLTKIDCLVHGLKNYKYKLQRDEAVYTDVIGYATHYTSTPKLKREDFEEILDGTLRELIEAVIEDERTL